MAAAVCVGAIKDKGTINIWPPFVGFVARTTSEAALAEQVNTISSPSVIFRNGRREQTVYNSLYIKGHSSLVEL